MSKKYDPMRIGFSAEVFKFGVRSRIGNHLIAKTKTMKMAVRIAESLERESTHEQ